MAAENIRTEYFITNMHDSIQYDEKFVNDNFIINGNIGEGNCLFYSVSLYVDVDPAVLRQMLCDFYKEYDKDNNNMGLTEGQKNAILTDANKTHRKSICQNGEWGGLTDLNLISVLLNVTTIFFNYNNSTKKYNVQVLNNVNDIERVIYIKYNGKNHFESMQLENTKIPIEKIKIDGVKVEKTLRTNNYNYISKPKENDLIGNTDDIPYNILRDMYSFESIWGSRNVHIFFNVRENCYSIYIHLHLPEDFNGDKKDIFIKVNYKNETNTQIFLEGTEKLNKDHNKNGDIVNFIRNQIAQLEAAAKAETAKAEAKAAAEAAEAAKAKAAAEAAAEAAKAKAAAEAAKAKANKATGVNKKTGADAAVNGVATSPKEATTKNANGCELFTFTANNKGGRKKRKTKRKARIRTVSKRFIKCPRVFSFKKRRSQIILLKEKTYKQKHRLNTNESFLRNHE